MGGWFEEGRRWDLSSTALRNSSKLLLLGVRRVPHAGSQVCMCCALPQVTCMVCMSEVAPAEATTMECGHTFCNDCWREHMRLAAQTARVWRRCYTAGRIPGWTPPQVAVVE